MCSWIQHMLNSTCIVISYRSDTMVDSSHQIVVINTKLTASVCDFNFSRYCCSDCFSRSQRILVQLTLKPRFTSSRASFFPFALTFAGSKFGSISISRYLFVTESKSWRVKPQALIIRFKFTVKSGPACAAVARDTPSFAALPR